jgi:LPS-assembly lipoprotein
MSSSERLAASGRAPGPRARRIEAHGRRAARARLLAAVLLAGVRGGCGFHLRGDVSYSFASLYVNGATAPQFALELQRALESGGATRVVTAPAEAQALLAITSVVDDKGVLSLSSGGRVREYLLTKRVAFNVRDAEGRDWLPASEFTVRRSYTFNETEVLAREAQEQRLLKEMQSDAVQQIVRRLQAAKKPAA